MSIQVSTRIDEATKQQFDKVCEAIGISPSNALSMFIKGVINYNGIPFAIKAYNSKSVEEDNEVKFGGWEGKISMSDDFNAPMEEFEERNTKKMSRAEMFGCMRGQFKMAEDFDAPLEDFKEYME